MNTKKILLCVSALLTSLGIYAMGKDSVSIVRNLGWKRVGSQWHTDSFNPQVKLENMHMSIQYQDGRKRGSFDLTYIENTAFIMMLEYKFDPDVSDRILREHSTLALIMRDLSKTELYIEDFPKTLPKKKRFNNS